MPLKNISPFSFSRFFLPHGNILQQFIIKYIFWLLRRAYANFQLERPSRTMLMLIFVVMALAENMYTRLPWLFDPVLSFSGSSCVGSSLFLTNKWTLLYYLMKLLQLYSVNKLQTTRSQHMRNQKKIKLDLTVRATFCTYFQLKP